MDGENLDLEAESFDGAESVRFERESFGALHQMLAWLTNAKRQAAWEEIEQTLRTFDSAEGFEGPCELVIGDRTKEVRPEIGRIRWQTVNIPGVALGQRVTPGHAFH
jgi:hypothetical protein